MVFGSFATFFILLGGLVILTYTPQFTSLDWFTLPRFRNFEKFRNLDENFDILGSFFLVYTVALHILGFPEKLVLLSL